MIRLGIFERLMLVAAKWKEDCFMFVLFFLPRSLAFRLYVDVPAKT